MNPLGSTSPPGGESVSIATSRHGSDDATAPV